MEEDTTFCTNCQRPIASGNYVMHNLHCLRNLEKCRVCGDAVPRAEMSVHAEHHVEESCSDCREKVRRDHHEMHKANECKLRKMSCAYCSLDVPGTELQEHEDYCGSRTERCTDCGKFVMLKYQQLHLDSNHEFLKLDDDPVPGPPPKLGDFMARTTPKQSRLISGLPSNDTGISSLDRLLALHLEEEEDVMFTGFGRSSASSSRNNYSHRNGEDSVCIPCEFCQGMIPSDELMQHQTGCSPDITSFPPQETTSKMNKTSVRPALASKNKVKALVKSGAGASAKAPVYTLDDSDDELTIVNSDEVVQLPCEFCSVVCPPSFLNKHQEICETRLASSLGSRHHWSMPTPGARRVTPPLTRKRLNAEAKTKGSHSIESDEVSAAPAAPAAPAKPLSIAPTIPGRIEESKKTSGPQIANPPPGTVPKQTRSGKKRRAPAPPTLT